MHKNTKPGITLLATALDVVQEIGSISGQSPTGDAPEGAGPSSAYSMQRARAKALAEVGSALLATSGNDRELMNIGRVLAREVYRFVEQHADSIDPSEMSEIVAPIAVAAHIARDILFTHQCIQLAERIANKCKEGTNQGPEGMYPFWQVAYCLAERRNLRAADVVLDKLMSPAARGQALARMIEEAQTQEFGQDTTLTSYLMKRGWRSLDELAAVERKSAAVVEALEGLSYALGSLYASHRMVDDIAAVLEKVSDSINPGKLYGLAVATRLNLSRVRPEHSKWPDPGDWREWFEEFRSRIRAEPKEFRFQVRSSFALELVLRAGDVQEVLWPTGTQKEQVHEVEQGDKEQRRTKTIWRRWSANDERLAAKLICYAHVDSEDFNTLLARLPTFLEGGFDDAAAPLMRLVHDGVFSAEKRDAIFTKVVEAWESSLSQEGTVFDDAPLVEAGEVLLAAGCTELADRLFALIPQKSQARCYAFAALADASAFGSKLLDPRTRTQAEVYEAALKSVIVVPPDDSGLRTMAETTLAEAVNREAIGNLWAIGKRAAERGCYDSAQGAFNRARELMKGIPAENSLHLRMDLVKHIAEGFVEGRLGT